MHPKRRKEKIMNITKKDECVIFEIISTESEEERMYNAINDLMEIYMEMPNDAELLKKFSNAISTLKVFGVDTIAAGRKRAIENAIIKRWTGFDDGKNGN